MPQSAFDLEAIVIESPCTVPWDSMSGDDARRYCGQCRLHVHDFSQMTRKEIDVLLRTTGGDCCKRVWRRPDGRVITRDCVRVVGALRRRLRAVGAAAAGILATLGLGGCRCARVTDGTPSPAPKAASPAPAAPAPGATVSTGR